MFEIFKKKNQGIKNNLKNSAHAENDNRLQEINEEIYKRNLELAIVNKTLSLLRKLYQISLLTLEPATLSEKVSEAIRIDLNTEMVGVFAFDQKDDSLHPFFFSKSERLVNLLSKLHLALRDVKISNISKNQLLNTVVYSKTASMTSDVSDLWHGAIEDESIKKINSESHIKAILLYPLMTPTRMVGVLAIGINRKYDALNDHEKDSIKSFIDVISVALDKAYLYKELQDANVKLSSLDKIKTEFLGLASHQLRSPLTAIKGYVSMVLEGDYGDINDQVRETCRRIFQSSKNLGVIVEDLLNVSKIEQGGMKYEMEPFSLTEIAESVSKDLSIVAESKDLKLDFKSDDSKMCMINADKEKIRQVLINFIDNSIKYTKTGGIHVAVKRVDDKVQFTVKDTGVGMTPEIKETLFQKFARGEGARMNTSGSGLGLYLAREIVEAHKGKVWVDSEGPDKGSTFFMQLDALS